MVGVIKGSLQKHLKTGGRQKLFVGEGVLKVSPPLPPQENFNHTHVCLVFFFFNFFFIFRFFKVFPGTKARYIAHVHWFDFRILARFIRIYPHQRVSSIGPSSCMRIELFGCVPQGK